MGNFFQQLKQRLDKTIADSQKKISGYKKRRPRKIKVRYSTPAFMPASARLYNASHTDVYEDQDPKVGHAIYLHYPNFKGGASNAFKIGNVDVGKILLKDKKLPVGHSAVVLVDKDGKADYYEYGRYTPEKGHVIGTEQRPTAKGGNWRQFKINSRYGAKDNDSTFIARIQGQLPYTNTGSYQILSVPSVNTEKAREWIMAEANNPNRKEYGLTNTCATGACDAVLPFRTRQDFHPFQENDQRGYSKEAIDWSYLPWTTDNYAEDVRKAANKIYIME